MEPTKETGSTPEIESAITKVMVRRSLIDKGVVCSPGHIWYQFSFVQDDIKYSGAIQITTAWEEANDAEAYVKKTYIYKRDTPLPKVKGKRSLR